jgi:hypothetical protein
MKEFEITELGNNIYNESDISPAQLNVTSRQINYWIDRAVIPFVEKQQPNEIDYKKRNPLKTKKENKTKWIRLNLSQAVWVCIVKDLLSFGVSIEQLAELSKSVWQKPREVLPHSMLYVSKTNDYNFAIGDNKLILNLGSVYLQHPMICLPMAPIISKVLAVDFGNEKKDLTYLTNIEKQIRDIVVFKRPKVIEIAFEAEHIKPITLTEQHKSREALARYILENKIAKGAKLLIDIRSQDNYKLTLIK